MKKKIFFGFLSIIVIGVAIFCISKLPRSENSFQETHQTSTFGLIFKYGNNSKNILNTFDNTFTKDMIANPSITTSLKLSDDELNRIHQKINDLNIFQDVKTIKTDDTFIFVTPCDSYDLLVQNQGIKIQLSWDCDLAGTNPKLQELSDFVRSIVESKEEYKKLPEAKGAYL